MSTDTLLVVEALPSQPLISVALVTAAPASGMDTRVVLDTASQPGSGSGPPPVPVKSSRLGEPAPAPVTLSGVALAVSAAVTSAGGASGLAARCTAAAPATCGVAIEVPLIVFVPPFSQLDVMPTPGA